MNIQIFRDGSTTSGRLAALWLTYCALPSREIRAYLLAEGEAAPFPTLWTKRFSAEEIAGLDTRGRLLVEVLAERYPPPGVARAARKEAA